MRDDLPFHVLLYSRLSDDRDVTSAPVNEEGGSGKTQPEAPSDPTPARSPSPGIMLHQAMSAAAAAAASGKRSTAELHINAPRFGDEDEGKRIA